MNDRTTRCGRRVRGWALPGLLGMTITGCGGGDPEFVIPDFVSPKGRKVLRDARRDLIACQSVQAAFTFAEIVNLSDPVGYASGMAAQSVGQGKPDLPADGTLQTMMKIDEICCLEIETRVERTYLDAKAAHKKQKMSDTEFSFWVHVVDFVYKKDCRLPNQMDPDLGWPSG